MRLYRKNGGTNMELINCPECNKQISGDAEVCPHCGHKFIEEIPKKARILMLLGELMISAGFMIGVGTSLTNNQTGIRFAGVMIMAGIITFAVGKIIRQ
jgi:DNA-directed RNA polymerase subunit RPC12/RpoP